MRSMLAVNVLFRVDAFNLSPLRIYAVVVAGRLTSSSKLDTRTTSNSGCPAATYAPSRRRSSPVELPSGCAAGEVVGTFIGAEPPISPEVDDRGAKGAAGA